MCPITSIKLNTINVETIAIVLSLPVNKLLTAKIAPNARISSADKAYPLVINWGSKVIFICLVASFLSYFCGGSFGYYDVFVSDFD